MTNQTEAPVSATTKITVNGFSFLLTVRSGAVAAEVANVLFEALEGMRHVVKDDAFRSFAAVKDGRDTVTWFKHPSTASADDTDKGDKTSAPRLVALDLEDTPPTPAPNAEAATQPAEVTEQRKLCNKIVATLESRKGGVTKLVYQFWSPEEYMQYPIYTVRGEADKRLVSEKTGFDLTSLPPGQSAEMWGDLTLVNGNPIKDAKSGNPTGNYYKNLADISFRQERK